MPGTLGDPVLPISAVLAPGHARCASGGLNVIGRGMDGTAQAITLPPAAGPCGALPCVIATQYGIRTVTIAKTIPFSTVPSLSVLLP